MAAAPCTLVVVFRNLVACAEEPEEAFQYGLWTVTRKKRHALLRLGSHYTRMCRKSFSGWELEVRGSPPHVHKARSSSSESEELLVEAQARD